MFNGLSIYTRVFFPNIIISIQGVVFFLAPWEKKSLKLRSLEPEQFEITQVNSENKSIKQAFKNGGKNRN